MADGSPDRARVGNCRLLWPAAANATAGLLYAQTNREERGLKPAPFFGYSAISKYVGPRGLQPCGSSSGYGPFFAGAYQTQNAQQEHAGADYWAQGCRSDGLLFRLGTGISRGVGIASATGSNLLGGIVRIVTSARTI